MNKRENRKRQKELEKILFKDPGNRRVRLELMELIAEDERLEPPKWP
jgi:hypothetical protein